MKKLLILACMLWSVGANAQFTPGQVLTAAELNSQFTLYAPLAGATFTGPVATTSTVNSTTPSTGSITTLGGLGVAQDVFVGGSMHGAAYITAGNISNTPISGSTGSFTTLSASSTVTLPSGSLPLTNLAIQAANTIVANGTGSPASPTAIAAPSCSTASSALQWSLGTGLACNSSINASSLGGTVASSYALLASPTFTGTPAAPTASATTNTTQIATTAMVNSAITGGSLAGSFTTLSSTGNFTPSQTNGIVGTTTNNNANAGSVGEYVTATSTATSLTSGSYADQSTVSLTAGDWDVQCSVQFSLASGTTVNAIVGGINTAANSNPNATPGFGFTNTSTNTLWTGSANEFAITPVVRESLSATTTVRCGAQANFAVSTVTATTFMRARRVR